MFLIRSAFWIGVVVMLLPTDERRQSDLYNSAVTTAERVWTFCDRNASLCEQGSQAWKLFAAKAQFGAKLVFDLANERMGAAPARQPVGFDAAPRATPAPAARPLPTRGFAKPARQDNTLTEEDAAPTWQAPQGRPRI